ncbi:conserved domain protein, partial [Enterococcus faecalis TX1467]
NKRITKHVKNFFYFKKIERISTKTNKDNAFNNTFIISNFSIKRNIFV